MACPFCSIMLKGAQASAGKSSPGKSSAAAGAADKPMVMTDLMSYVADRLPGVRDGARRPPCRRDRPSPRASGEPAS